jgi:hypothetical protein
LLNRVLDCRSVDRLVLLGTLSRSSLGGRGLLLLGGFVDTIGGAGISGLVLVLGITALLLLRILLGLLGSGDASSPALQLALPESLDQLGAQEDHAVRVLRAIGILRGTRKLARDILLKPLDVDGAQSRQVEEVTTTVSSSQSLDLGTGVKLLFVAARLDLVRRQSAGRGDLLHDLVRGLIPMQGRQVFRVDTIDDERVLGRLVLLLRGDVRVDGLAGRVSLHLDPILLLLLGGLRLGRSLLGSVILFPA